MQSELLHQAREKAKILLQGLQRDEATVAALKDGAPVFKAAVDAARSTLDNIDRAAKGAASSRDSD